MFPISGSKVKMIVVLGIQPPVIQVSVPVQVILDTKSEFDEIDLSANIDTDFPVEIIELLLDQRLIDFEVKRGTIISIWMSLLK